jgi:hypothetical protein
MNEKDAQMAAARRTHNVVALNRGNTMAGSPEEPDESERPEGVRMVRAVDVVEKKISWLWSKRIPRGYITDFVGDPGLGKSQVAGDLAARLSNGSLWPDSGNSDPGATLFLSSEDGLADVQRPRLRIAGAELSRIGFLTGKLKPEHPTVEFLLNLKDDLRMIEESLPAWEKELGLPIRLLVVDPFMNHLGGVDPNKEGEARPLLAEIASFLARTALPMIAIRHMNKAEEKALLYRAGGSIAFTGSARAQYLIGEDPDNPARRIFARIKGNLSVEPESLAFEILPSTADPDIPTVHWLGPSAKRAVDVIGRKDDHGGPQKDRATSMLMEILGEGQDVPAVTIFEKAKGIGIGEHTVRAAGKKLGVKMRPGSFGGGWVWTLAEDVP